LQITAEIGGLLYDAAPAPQVPEPAIEPAAD
jgi:hypothetical protein